MAPAVESNKYARESTNLIVASRKPWGSSNGSGRANYGILEVPHLRKLGHQMEKKMAAANIEAEEKRIRPQSGQRGAAKEALAKEWARREEEAKQRPARQHNRLYHRSSVDNPLANGWDASTTTNASTSSGIRKSHSTTLRVFGESVLPSSVRTHVAPYMRPLTADLEGDRQRAQEQAKKDQEHLSKINQFKELSTRMCQENPHGMTRLALAKLKAANSGLICLADLPALSSDAQ